MNIVEKIRSGECKKVKWTGASDVWQCFDKIINMTTQEVEAFVICAHCERIFKFGKGCSPSNLKKHICYKRQSEESLLVPMTTKTQMLRKNPFANVRKKALATAIQKEFVAVSDQIREEVVQNCVNFVARDLRSCDTVDSKGFKELARSLIEIGTKLKTTNFSINDILPHSTTISRKLHKQHATEVEAFVASVQPIIQEGRCAGTLDMWTECKTQINFLTFTVHYLDTLWQLQTRILFTVEFMSCDENENTRLKSAENIISSIADKFEEFNLERDLHKKMTFTSDQGSNIEHALQYHSRINCALDALNTILKHTFDKVTLQEHAPHVLDLITKCKSLVEYLKRTGRIRMLKTIVKQEFPSKWNTKFDMLFAVRQNLNAIAEILEKSGESNRLIGIEKYLIDRVHVFLEPFESAMLLFESEKKPTIHFVLLHMHILKEKLMKLRNEESNNEMLYIISHCLDNVFDTKFYPDKIHKIAAFLWPEYKQLRYLSELERGEVHSLVKQELHNISMMIPASCPFEYLDMTDNFCDVKFNDDDDMLAKYKDVHTIKNNNFDSQINLEMELYKSVCYADNNILHWWQLHEEEFPLLAKLARHILCIPAASAASERSFSSTDRILEERRINLKSVNLDAILFLNSQQMQQN